MYIFAQPLCMNRKQHKVNYWTEFNRFEFRILLLLGCFTKVKELSLPYYLPIAGGRITRFTPFPRVLVLCELQTARIWTKLTVSISYSSNNYTMGTDDRAYPLVWILHQQYIQAGVHKFRFFTEHFVILIQKSQNNKLFL